MAHRLDSGGKFPPTVTEDDREIEVMNEEVFHEEALDSTAEPAPDDAVEQFLALEAELSGIDLDRHSDTGGISDAEVETDATEDILTLRVTAGRTDEQPSGLVRGAEPIPAANVPESYPLAVTTESALALQVGLRTGGTTTVYLDWPGGEGVKASSPLGRLLAALDVSPDSFADLYGERLPLEREAGYYTVVLPPEQPKGSGDWELGVVGGVAFNLTVVGLLALATTGLPVGGVLWWLLVPFLVVNLAVLPFATYRDATYLRTHSDWNQGPPFWAALSMVPVVNLGVSALYLWSRSRARFLGSEPPLTTKLRRVLRRFI